MMMSISTGILYHIHTTEQRLHTTEHRQFELVIIIVQRIKEKIEEIAKQEEVN